MANTVTPPAAGAATRREHIEIWAPTVLPSQVLVVPAGQVGAVAAAVQNGTTSSPQLNNSPFVHALAVLYGRAPGTAEHTGFSPISLPVHVNLVLAGHVAAALAPAAQVGAAMGAHPTVPPVAAVPVHVATPL